MEQRLDIRILGPLEVTDGARILDLGGFGQRTLLARLAVAANRVVAVETLVDELWGQEVPGGAKQAVQARASRLRRALGEASRLEARAGGYVLRLDPRELDAARFEALIGQARAAAAHGDVHAATKLWLDAEGLWRGPALEEFGDFSFARAEAARLEELRLAAVEARLGVELTLGGHADVVAQLETLVGAYPYREGLWGHLMLGLYRCGRQADALGAYRRVRAIFGEELGITPGPELVRLEEAILLQKSELDWVPPAIGTDAGSSRPQSATPHNLPHPRSSFVGRQRELEEVEALLERHGLVTVVGPGGIGKTRLAVELGRRLLNRFPDGVWLVELAPVRDSSLIPNALAAAMGVRAEGDRPVLDTLAAVLAGRHTLVLLDNCEHVVDAAAALVDALLASGPGLTVLATSQEALRVEGEAVWRTPALGVAVDVGTLDPALGSDAVRLFCHRAEANSGFRLDGENASAVAELCRRLDGIPLALELAAARSSLFGPVDMLARLDDRFALLARGRRTGEARHQTLRSAIEWSYDLLDPAEQALFRRLSVFAGGFTTAGAEFLAEDAIDRSSTVDRLANLVDKSLVEVDESRGSSRFRLLESLSAFGEERLRVAGEELPVRRRHLDFHVRLGEDLGVRLHSNDAATALERFEGEEANLRSAFDWSLRHDVDAALRLIAVRGSFWITRGRLDEAYHACERALAIAEPASSGARCAALRVAGHVACARGRFDEASRYLDEAFASSRELGDPAATAEAIAGLGWVAFEQGKYEDAQRLNEQSLEEWNLSAVKHGCVESVAETLHNLGILAFERGDALSAERWFDRSLRASEEFGPLERIPPLYGLGKLARAEEQWDLAAEMFNASAVLAEEVGFHRWVAFSRLFLASIARQRGELDVARAQLRHAIGLASRLGDTICLAWCLEILAGIATANDQLRWAASLLGAAEALRESIGAPVQPSERANYEATVLQTTAGLTPTDLRAEWDRGRRMPLGQVLSLADE